MKLSNNHRSFGLLFLLVLLVGANDCAASGVSDWKKEKVVAALRAGDVDQARSAINEVELDVSTVSLLNDLWRGRGASADQEVARAVSSSVQVRLELAEVLLWAHRNGLETIPLEELLSFVRGVLLSNEPEEVKSRALLVIGTGQQVRDVPLLAAEARKEAAPSFQVAVQALINMDTSTADASLNDLLSQIKNQSLRTYLFDAIARKREIGPTRPNG